MRRPVGMQQITEDGLYGWLKEDVELWLEGCGAVDGGGCGAMARERCGAVDGRGCRAMTRERCGAVAGGGC